MNQSLRVIRDEHDDYDAACGLIGAPLLETRTLRREVSRARRPSYLEITAILAAVAALGTWFGAVLI
jgi:hypothetical protein